VLVSLAQVVITLAGKEKLVIDPVLDTSPAPPTPASSAGSRSVASKSAYVVCAVSVSPCVVAVQLTVSIVQYVAMQAEEAAAPA
jgi:hypothetical protein